MGESKKRPINYRKLGDAISSVLLTKYVLVRLKVRFSCEEFLLVFRINYNEHDAFWKLKIPRREWSAACWYILVTTMGIISNREQSRKIEFGVHTLLIKNCDRWVCA